MPPLARFGLEGKIVIVTGAGRGIGRTIALECAQSGARIAVGSRTTAELETLAAEIEAAGGACFLSPTRRDGCKLHRAFYGCGRRALRAD